MLRHVLTDDEWNAIRHLLPAQKNRRGRPWSDHRTVISGILWILHTCQQSLVNGKPFTIDFGVGLSKISGIGSFVIFCVDLTRLVKLTGHCGVLMAVSSVLIDVPRE